MMIPRIKKGSSFGIKLEKGKARQNCESGKDLIRIGDRKYSALLEESSWQE
jgi:hypothetical protein